jgi:hypothetical protein
MRRYYSNGARGRRSSATHWSKYLLVGAVYKERLSEWSELPIGVVCKGTDGRMIAIGLGKCGLQGTDERMARIRVGTVCKVPMAGWLL